MKHPCLLLTTIIIFFVFTLHSEILSAEPRPGFPGAVGFGANTKGGRGGQVIKVTNLNDSGPGSLRAAVETTGARIVVFEVSGIIMLNQEIKITDPFITIAGETSPGGIFVSGHTVSINTHEVIIRHMRFGAGIHNVELSRTSGGEIIYYDVPQYDFPPTGNSPDGCKGEVTVEGLKYSYPCAISGGTNPEQLDSFVIMGDYWASNQAYNIILDHCSFRWGVDETLTLTGGVTAATVQYCIISEGLSKAGHPKGEHSKGALISGKYEYPNDITFFENYLPHHVDRAPYIYSLGDNHRSGYASDLTRVDLRGNVTYNSKTPTYIKGEPLVNSIGNYMKYGPSTGVQTRGTMLDDDLNPPLGTLYIKGNISPTRPLQSDPEWDVQDADRFNNPSVLADTGWQKSTPHDFGYTLPVTQMSGSYARKVVEYAGAIYPERDSVDTRLVNDFIHDTGSIIGHIDYPDDYPSYATPAPPVDEDDDGMADVWENMKGLNISANDSALDHDGDGYTNIEAYLHWLAAGYKVDQIGIDYEPPIVSHQLFCPPLPFGTNEFLLTVSTSENSICRFSSRASTPYGEMTDVLSTTGSTSHSHTFSGLENGEHYEYYIRCEDGYGNSNKEDYTIEFSIATAELDASLRCDVNQDQSIDAVDSLLILKRLTNSDMGATGWQDSQITGDADCSGFVTSGDASLVLRYSAGADSGGISSCDNQTE